jgi:predicted RNA-binding Zn-ribbon protein involved in translation (DUF1610 family)
MAHKSDYGNECSSCGIWVQNTGDWVCEDCGEPTCEKCGIVEDDNNEFICLYCFSTERKQLV